MAQVKEGRPPVSAITVSSAKDDLMDLLAHRLRTKGDGTFASRHEVLGIVTEEFYELLEAVKSESTDRLKAELLDVAVGCLFGVACINAGYVE
jgi:hypothetical protein